MHCWPRAVAQSAGTRGAGIHGQCRVVAGSSREGSTSPKRRHAGKACWAFQSTPCSRWCEGKTLTAEAVRTTSLLLANQTRCRSLLHKSLQVKMNGGMAYQHRCRPPNHLSGFIGHELGVGHSNAGDDTDGARILCSAGAGGSHRPAATVTGRQVSHPSLLRIAAALPMVSAAIES